MENINPTVKLPFVDALSYGGQMFLIGIATVFLVLGVIFLCLLVFKYAFANVKSKPVKTEKVVTPITPPSVHVATDAEIVAVIAAAIAMAEEEVGNGQKFRVVSFRRK